MTSSNPRKNIEPVLADVRHHGKRYQRPPVKNKGGAGLRKLKPRGLVELERSSERRRRIAVAGSAIGSIILVVLFWWLGEGMLIQGSVNKNYSSVRSGLLQLLSMQTSTAALGSNGQLSLAPIFSQYSEAVKGINALSSAAIDFSGNAAALGDNWMADFFGGNGSDLLSTLKKITGDLSSIISANNQLSSGSSSSASGLGSNALVLESGLLRYSSAADGLYSLLNSTSSHLLLAFADPSVSLRPAGGELTAYADLTINKGQLENTAVSSFSAPDSQLPWKALPPPPELGGSGSVWGAGEANWFFDFPSSAQKMAYFLQSSKEYASSSETFSGVILINSSAWQRIIATIDPSLLPKSGSTVSVAYLGKALPQLFKEIPGLSPAAKQDLIGAIGEGLANKNIMIYFPDSRLEGMAEWAGNDGGVFSLPYNFNGDYLGVANITPAASLSGTVLEEHVVLKSQIDSSGMINDDLTVENIFQNPSYPNYHAYRRDLLQIFSSPSSALISADGMSSSLFGELKQYRAGYQTDPNLSAVEQSFMQSSVPGISEFSESGLKVYEGWLSANVGAAAKLHLTYMGGKANIASGEKFQFVFDKQSGVNQTLDYLVQAPLGYGWAEAQGQGSVYSYHSSNLAPRTTITLTLVKTN
ncbi:MAG: hypothetical protein KGL39_05910 [Patescibacteria group bacterium]|nr:hypothetical protein [Patescibacteria group bacterium]